MSRQVNRTETSKLFVGSSNVRRSVGDITELKLSIQEQGILEPLLVRPLKNRFEVVVGSRRYEAAKALGFGKVPVIIKQMNDTEALLLSLVENIQRSDLELEEEAEGVLKLMKLDPKRFANAKAVAKALGRSESSIRELLDAYELTFKLRQKGMKIHAIKSPSEEQRQSGEVIPLKHAEFVAASLKSEEVKSLPKRELEHKTQEIIRTIAPLTKEDAKRVVDRFKKSPKKSVDRIKQEALSSWVIHLEPRIARALVRAAEEQLLSQEQIIATAVEQWLVSKGFLAKVS